MTRKQLILEVARREGKKHNLPIAQISESVRHTLVVLSELKASDALKLIEGVWK